MKPMLHKCHVSIDVDLTFQIKEILMKSGWTNRRKLEITFRLTRPVLDKCLDILGACESDSGKFVAIPETLSNSNILAPDERITKMKNKLIERRFSKLPARIIQQPNDCFILRGEIEFQPANTWMHEYFNPKAFNRTLANTTDVEAYFNRELVGSSRTGNLNLIKKMNCLVCELDLPNMILDLSQIKEVLFCFDFECYREKFVEDWQCMNRELLEVRLVSVGFEIQTNKGETDV